MNLNLASRMSNLKASEIREMLKLTQKPEIISFAGGLPAPEFFPVEKLKEVSQIVLSEQGRVALQYTTTEGYKPLREWVCNRMNKNYNLNFDADNVLIVQGSQQTLDLTGKVFLDKGDLVLCESPTYLAAISAFKAYECDFLEVPTDDDGMIMEDLEKMLKENNNVKVIYAIPDFQNPTGKTWSVERRKKLAELAEKYNVFVLEDNPYGDLRFEGERPPSIQSFDKAGNVLFTGSFSKILCPGYRLGWIIGDKELVSKYTIVKQGTDLQCNTLAQMEIAKFLEMYGIDDHIAGILEVYRNRRDLAVKTMEEHFPACVKFTRPSGGLFTWVELPEGIDAREVFKKSIEQNVAFVPGGSFFPTSNKNNTMRINYSNMPEDRIVEGLKRLGKVLHEMID